ncbi:single-stranded-DNA-specific exonuclease RecJ [Lacihabitans sp. CCS-44]|uniref:single-stranded-DNA-specific exonuclease RecJ n=1 Tax=Lacihabitans sp. CCS-44 TaxID=2487331 RepID=UPI0020CBC51F|nr:single-stranded-DNA-specific exonuclease RecJ [Lacihabitans sp. CCS-44]MCP9755640.1 single-stranded-DNA-specific exonuclease RecJ [Lacihabitans sp. CCS-44]
MEKNWNFKPTPTQSTDLQIVSDLVNQLSVSKSMATMLWQRGVKDFDEAKHFFRPQIDDLHDPFLMRDMDIAVDRLIKAIDENEIILIFGDYDVDGTTAVALFYGFLKNYYPNIEYYNPDRYKEGYGISTLGIDYAAEIGATLMISLDCGIKSIDKIEYAQTKYGIDFIICDHHEPGDELPAAVAVLDPKRSDCPYPFKELTGNGVGFKLLTALCIRKEIPIENLFEFLDLAMVSIASDIVPIVGENRILAYFGLKKINENPRTGLKALKQVAGFSGEMSIENVVFVLGPRINAAGRIKHAKAAVQLLLADDFDEALSFAYEIQNNNTERKGHDSRITEEALDMIRKDDWLLNIAKSTVLFSENWHKGVIGIVASRCIENFHRPTIIFTKSGDKVAAGSARSVPGFDLYAAIERSAHLLIQFGGHMHAAGMTIEIDKIDEFKALFDQIVTEMILEEQLVPKINIDIKIDLSEISPKFYRIMKQMAPFGPHNMQPIFVSENLSLAAEPRILKEKHLKLEILDEDTGSVFSAIGFGMVDDFYQNLKAGHKFSMAYSIEENTFRDKTTLQLFVRDIKF